jgi:protoheme IX farnesyltransferase
MRGRSTGRTWRDLVSLTKPRVTVAVVLTTAAGLVVGDARAEAASVITTLAGMVLLVGGAAALNCWLERDLDAHMTRTRDRALPAGRLAPRTALVFSLAISMLALPLLAHGAGLVATALALLAHLVYVAVYTPLKRLTPHALLVGAVPGAIPPLVGSAAATGGAPEAPAWVLAAILFAWQVPHFVAIATRRRDEYAAAGYRVLPIVIGEAAARTRALAWSAAVVVASFLLAPAGATGTGFLVAAPLLALALFAVALRRPRPGRTIAWARTLFLASLAHMLLLHVALFATRA